MNQPVTYLAAGMFNGGTNMLNAYVCQSLERLGKPCYLPQRDGFELANVFEILNEAKLPGLTEAMISEIAHWVPYYLDLGVFMKSAIAVVANLDEPIDDGMVVEIATAHACNIPVIGIRTDLRTPFGNVNDALAINPFPVQQCDVFIRSATVTGDFPMVLANMDHVIDQTIDAMEELIKTKKNKMSDSDNPTIKNILKGATMLYENISDIHTKESILEIAKRYLNNRAFFLSNAPKIVGL